MELKVFPYFTSMPSVINLLSFALENLLIPPVGNVFNTSPVTPLKRLNSSVDLDSYSGSGCALFVRSQRSLGRRDWSIGKAQWTPIVHSRGRCSVALRSASKTLKPIPFYMLLCQTLRIYLIAKDQTFLRPWASRTPLIPAPTMMTCRSLTVSVLIFTSLRALGRWCNDWRQRETSEVVVVY